jgi:hypothetical protein
MTFCARRAPHQNKEIIATMSYCRFGWDSSDVYIYQSGSDDEPYLVCCGCAHLRTFGALMVHIDQHRAYGQHVPSYVDARIAAEITAGDSGIPAGDVPTTRVRDPGAQRPAIEMPPCRDCGGRGLDHADSCWTQWFRRPAGDDVKKT